ncbi:substrate-binding periplasmic protein [Duganella sp. S19_KUP01_CR8]|uniref:substrate-binding periplasmic protein n=1 Tax=Duganella sp. S19_KUP01_CR8 TaxID=3025502 RepID=UPI002FCDDAB1
MNTLLLRMVAAGMAALPGACWAASDGQAQVTLHYYERPPLHYTDAHARPAGFIVEKTSSIFNQAGISYAWKVTPANRILALIKTAPGYHCTPGWYKNAERMQYARFSAPIYIDKPLVGLSRADFSAGEGITARDLFRRPALRLLLKQNFSQGAYMDKLIGQMPDANIQRVSAEVPVMVKMIRLGRADLIVTTQEETEAFVASAGYRMDEFRVLKFPDVPAEEKRYILCGNNVPMELMRQLDEAISKP